MLFANVPDGGVHLDIPVAPGRWGRRRLSTAGRGVRGAGGRGGGDNPTRGAEVGVALMARGALPSRVRHGGEARGGGGAGVRARSSRRTEGACGGALGAIGAGRGGWERRSASAREGHPHGAAFAVVAAVVGDDVGRRTATGARWRRPRALVGWSRLVGATGDGGELVLVGGEGAGCSEGRARWGRETKGDGGTKPRSGLSFLSNSSVVSRLVLLT